jgi:flavin prenyltransferase
MAPPMPAFYHRPQNLDDVINQTVNRLLDLMGIELAQDLFTRWQGARSHSGHE